MKKVIFHLGAHKTATTYIQNRLQANDDLLEAHNVYYPGIGEMRRYFTYRIHDKTRNDFTTRMLSLRETHDILLSDENMAGGIDDVMRLDRQYIETAPKLARYCQIMETDAPTVFFALREYSSFVISIYCEYLRHYPYLDFETFARQYQASGFSWVALIGEMLSAVPKAEIYLWDFADFPALEEDILAAMTGVKKGEFKPLHGMHRESFSSLAVNCIAALSGVIDLRNMQKLLPALTKAFPKSREYPAFNPFPAEYVAEAKAHYRSDIEKIGELFPGVTIFKPDAGDAPDVSGDEAAGGAVANGV
jgi:hypothetical protein